MSAEDEAAYGQARESATDVQALTQICKYIAYACAQIC